MYLSLSRKAPHAFTSVPSHLVTRAHRRLVPPSVQYGRKISLETMSTVVVVIVVYRSYAGAYVDGLLT